MGPIKARRALKWIAAGETGGQKKQTYYSTPKGLNQNMDVFPGKYAIKFDEKYLL